MKIKIMLSLLIVLAFSLTVLGNDWDNIKFFSKSPLLNGKSESIPLDGSANNNDNQIGRPYVRISERTNFKKCLKAPVDHFTSDVKQAVSNLTTGISDQGNALKEAILVELTLLGTNINKLVNNVAGNVKENGFISTIGFLVKELTSIIPAVTAETETFIVKVQIILKEFPEIGAKLTSSTRQTISNLVNEMRKCITDILKGGKP